MSAPERDIVVYSSVINNRVFFTFNHVFKQYFGLNILLTNFIEDYQNTTLPRLNYSNIETDGFDVKPYGLLAEKGIKEQNIECRKWENTLIFYETEEKGNLPFDIFSATFFLISRYEEYLAHKPDSHGRFKAESSVAFLNGFLHRPIVDEWLQILARMLKQRYPELNIRERKFSHQVTIDVDQAYKYKSKGIIRNAVSTVKELVQLDFPSLLARLSFATRQKVDPYDNYIFIIEESYKRNIKPYFFFLLGTFGKHDKNIPASKSNMKRLISDLALDHKVGIHPSYRSNKSLKKHYSEIKTLSDIIGKPVNMSRQHFLKMRMPVTYKNLLKFEITEDHTMGYSETYGFRAGTSVPFFFYDLSLEKSTTLTIVPFALMDSTFKYHLRTNPDDTFDKYKKIIDKVKATNGTLVTLWHNDNFEPNTKKGRIWRDTFVKVLNHCHN